MQGFALLFQRSTKSFLILILPHRMRGSWSGIYHYREGNFPLDFILRFAQRNSLSWRTISLSISSFVSPSEIPYREGRFPSRFLSSFRPAKFIIVKEDFLLDFFFVSPSEIHYREGRFPSRFLSSFRPAKFLFDFLSFSGFHLNSPLLRNVVWWVLSILCLASRRLKYLKVTVHLFVVR